MIELIRPKVRALIEDNIAKKGLESFVYRNSNTWTLAEENISSISKVLLNDEELGTGEYSYDSETNRITITATGLASQDIIQVYYSYYKYSDAEINEYIRGALVWMSTIAEGADDYELEDDYIEPTPDNRTMDLIALIASILIKPDYTTYRLPTVSVVYSGRMPKDQKIQKLINRFYYGKGIGGILELS